MGADAESTGGNGDGSGRRSTGAPPVDFTTLVLSIQESALVMMGAKDGADFGVDKNLDAARYQIDLLAMLEVKTSGNLTDDEDRLLRTVLYDLRMAFVQAKKS